MSKHQSLQISDQLKPLDSILSPLDGESLCTQSHIPVVDSPVDTVLIPPLWLQLDPCFPPRSPPPPRASCLGFSPPPGLELVWLRESPVWLLPPCLLPPACLLPPDAWEAPELASSTPPVTHTLLLRLSRFSSDTQHSAKMCGKLFSTVKNHVRLFAQRKQIHTEGRKRHNILLHEPMWVLLPAEFSFITQRSASNMVAFPIVAVKLVVMVVLQ